MKMTRQALDTNVAVLIERNVGTGPDFPGSRAPAYLGYGRQHQKYMWKNKGFGDIFAEGI